jgi:hypothetical protein
MDGLNQERKAIEQSMQSEAWRVWLPAWRMAERVAVRLVLYRPDWAPGSGGGWTLPEQERFTVR